jgi:argininosuccinate lyase
LGKAFQSRVPSESLRESAYRYELKSKEFLFDGLGIADMAHVAMLIKAGIVQKDIGKSILKKLLTFQKIPVSKLPLDSSRGDIYTNREYFLKKKLKHLSHYIHTGRARREATTIAFLIRCRESLADLGISLGILCKELLSLARQHKRTYMTDFTYLQHAHPTTLGHYVSGYLYALIRDLMRIKDVYLKINQSPAGAGSVNGSQLPLNRNYLRSLMEFDDIIVHTRDAMWRHDVIIESALPLLTTLTTISRFSEELIIWNTSEFGFIELAPSHIRRSVIMPQKKNPYSLAFIRGLARDMIGKFVSIAATGHTTSGQPDNRIFINYSLPDCIDETRRAVDLFADVISHCKFNKRRLSDSAQEGFTIATDLTDFLVAKWDIDNRTAYNIITKAIENMCSKQEDKVTPEIIFHAAKELGISLPEMLERGFYTNFNIKKLIEKRKGIGGASIQSVDMMVRECEKQIAEAVKFFNQKNPDLFRKRFYRKINRIAGNK